MVPTSLMVWRVAVEKRFTGPPMEARYQKAAQSTSQDLAYRSEQVMHRRCRSLPEGLNAAVRVFQSASEDGVGTAAAAPAYDWYR
jgi:hypothetical protein